MSSTKATLTDDTTLQFSEAPWTDGTVRPGDTLDVIRLGRGTVLVTDRSLNVPSLAASFRASLADAGVSESDLLDGLETTKEAMAEERRRALADASGNEPASEDRAR